MPRGRPPKAPRPVVAPVISDKPDKKPIVDMLETLANDETAPAAARAGAARTLLEMQGLIGRNQLPPGQGTHVVPLSLASRVELEAELARLRRLSPVQTQANTGA